MKTTALSLIIAALVGIVVGMLSMLIVGEMLFSNTYFVEFSRWLIAEHGGKFGIPKSENVDTLHFLLDPVAGSVGFFIGVASLVPVFRLVKKYGWSERQRVPHSN